MEITKSEFEKILSVATSSQVEVYEKVQPQFGATYEECKADVLGDVGTSAAEDGQHEKLTAAVKQWVAIRAFLAVFRQLDLVLTPTGFGVVSTNQMAPASKQRVDALVGHLRDSALRAHGDLLFHLCHVDRWGKTAQAMENIDTLFYDFQRLIGEADGALRLKLSNQYMDELLDHVRCASLPVGDIPIVFQCRHIINLWIAGDQEAVRLKMRRLLSQLDADLEKYATYGEFGYPVNHHENFQNTQDAPAYIFG